MRFLRIAALLLLTTCAFGLSASAQKTFKYQMDRGTGSSREAVNIVITQQKNGYLVSGEYIANQGVCKISGSYFPATERLKATCVIDGDRSGRTFQVTGFKLTGKDAIQISVSGGGGGTVVAYRDGIKPKDDTTGGTTPKDTGGCKMAGLWSQNTPGIGPTDWDIKADGTAEEKGIGYAKGKASMKGNVLRINWDTTTGYSGYYEWTLDATCTSSVEGHLKFEKPRTDRLDSSVKKK